MIGSPILRLLEEGLRHHVLGDDERAIACWRELLELEPGNVKALRLLEMVERSRRRASSVPSPEKTPTFFAEAQQEKTQPHAVGPHAEVGPIAGEGKSKAGGTPAAGADGARDRDAREERVAEELRGLLQSVEDLFGLGDFSGSLEVVEKVLAIDPSHPAALDYLAKNRKTLTHLYESKLGSVGARPRVVLRPDEILWLNIDHRAGFVLSQIDGTVTVDELYMLSGMSRMETARILAGLLEDGVIAIG